MTTHPMRWIAGTGQIIPVFIIKAGTEGHSPTNAPPDPVTVRSVEDHYEFVASESCLFTDRRLAIVEARRLQEKERRATAIAVIEKKLLNGTGLTPTSPTTSVSSSDTRAPVVEVSVSVEEEVVMSEDEKPQKLLDRVIYVIGTETLSVGEICTRLEKRCWMPKRRSSVSNILSAHKNRFICPVRGRYSLATKAKISPILGDDPSNDTLDLGEALQAMSDESDEDEGKNDESENDDDEEGDESDDDDEDDADLAKSKAKVQSEFSTWMNQPMHSVNPTHCHYQNEDVVLSEKQTGGKWHTEIFVHGLELWCEGNDEDRSVARMAAEDQLRSKVQKISRIVDTLGC
jgi:hypothetical protein